MGGERTDDQSDCEHDKEGNRIAGKRKVQLKMRVCEKIVDKYDTKKSRNNAKAVTFCITGNDYQSKYIKQGDICRTGRHAKEKQERT